MKRKRPCELEDSSDEEDEDPGVSESCSDGTSALSVQDQEASKLTSVYNNPAGISSMFCRSGKDM